MLHIEDELKKCDFNDKRLTERAALLGKTFSENPELSINAACGSAEESKAAYRFFQNSKVTPCKILSNHIDNTLARIKETKNDILIIQDTTDLIYTQFPSISGMGVNHTDEHFSSEVRGIRLHSSFAVDLFGVPLGILKQSFFTHEDYRSARNQAESNIEMVNKHISIEKKESYRWIEHLKEAKQLTQSLPGNVIHVADRECDIYEFLFQAEMDKLTYVIRSSNDRIVENDDDRGGADTIQKRLDTSTKLGKIRVIKNHRPIDCRVKVINVTLRPPYRSPAARSDSYELNSITANVVEVKSMPTSEIKLHWKLITNIPVQGFNEAVKVIDIYKRRWSIECFHRILKSGFKVEKARLNDRYRIENLASILSIASWYIYWIYMFARELPIMNASKIFDTLAIKVLKTSAKKLKVSLSGKFTIKKAVFILARLGGFSGRKSDGEPGMLSIWRGWGKLNERTEFYEELTYG